MKIETSTYYVNDDATITYHVFSNPDLQQLQRLFTDNKVIEQISNFLNDTFVKNCRRFIIAAPHGGEVLSKIVLGFEVVDPLTIKDVVEVRHFNYYSQRKSLTHTHTLFYPDAEYTTLLNDPVFINTFLHTFKSLISLHDANS